MENEIQKLDDNKESALIKKEDILQLISTVINNSTNDRIRALRLIDDLTKDFEQLSDILYKSRAVTALLDIAGKATAEQNKLLATIQKFASDKLQAENVEKIISAEQFGNVLDMMDQLEVGPKKFIKKDRTASSKLDIIKTTLKNHKDEDGVDVEYSDMENVDEDD